VKAESRSCRTTSRVCLFTTPGIAYSAIIRTCSWKCLTLGEPTYPHALNRGSPPTPWPNGLSKRPAPIGNIIGAQRLTERSACNWSRLRLRRSPARPDWAFFKADLPKSLENEGRPG
jgi:hypothetical protein